MLSSLPMACQCLATYLARTPSLPCTYFALTSIKPTSHNLLYHTVSLLQVTHCCLQERYESATMSWQHPETCYPPATLAALRSGKANADLLEQRQAAWKDAFRGLYLALRHRQCDAFYLATPLVTARPPPPPFLLLAKRSAGSACRTSIGTQAFA